MGGGGREIGFPDGVWREGRKIGKGRRMMGGGVWAMSREGGNMGLGELNSVYFI